MFRRRSLSLSVTIGALLAISACGSGGSSESAYPSKDITLISTFAAGSAPDTTARVLAKAIEDDTGKKVVVQNEPGGTGMVGLTKLSSAKPDGYTIAYSGANQVTAVPQLVKTAFKGPEMITGIAQVNESVSSVFVNAKSPITSIEDLVAAAKARKVTVAVPAPTSTQNFQFSLFEKAAGVKLKRVFTGAGKQVLPVVNGTIEVGVVQPDGAAQFVEKGDLRFLGYFGETKPAGMSIESFADAGYAVDYFGFQGVVGPKGMSAEVVSEVSSLIEKAIATDGFRAHMKRSFGAASYEDGPAFSKYLAKNFSDNTRLLDEFGLNK